MALCFNHFLRSNMSNQFLTFLFSPLGHPIIKNFYHYFFPLMKKVTKKSSPTKLFLISMFLSLNNLNSHETFVSKLAIHMVEYSRFHKKLSFSSNSRLFLASEKLEIYGKPSYGGGNDRNLPSFLKNLWCKIYNKYYNFF